jgi:hypothetical protein
MRATGIGVATDCAVRRSQRQIWRATPAVKSALVNFSLDIITTSCILNSR